MKDKTVALIVCLIMFIGWIPLGLEARTYVVTIINSTTGLPEEGLSPTFYALSNVEDGYDVSKPSLSDIGNGMYSFNLTTPSDANVAGIINTALDAPDKMIPVYVPKENDNLDVASSTLATAAALTTVDSNVDAIKVETDKLSFDGSNNVYATINGLGILNNPATPAEIDAQLSASHGSGTWETATGFSTHSANDVTGGTTVAQADTNLAASVLANAITVASISSTLSAVHGPGSWLSATGFSTHSATDVTGGRTVAAAETNAVGADGDSHKTLSDQIDLTATAAALATVDSNVDAIKTQTDKFHFDASNNVRAVSNATGIGNQPASVSEIVAGNWNALTANYQIAGSMSAILNAAAEGANPTCTYPSLTGGVHEAYPVISNNGVQLILRGDAKYLTFDLTTSYNLTGRKAYLMIKEHKSADNSTAIVNRVTTTTDAVNGLTDITLTITETATVGEYYGEIEVRDNDETNPNTAIQFKVIIDDDIRQ